MRQPALENSMLTLGRTIFSLTICLIMGACSFPGLKYQPGGSEAWRSSPDEGGAEAVAITRISPSLIGHMNKKSAVAGQSVSRAPANQSPDWEYRVGKGDVLSVIVWDHPELTNPTGEFESLKSAGRLVRADGTIFFPHAGVAKVDGLTVEQVRRLITDALSAVIESPQVDVRVIEYRSQHVYVVGDVLSPCKIPISDKPLNVIDALNACETIRPSESHRSVVVERGDQRRPINLHALYRGEDPILYQPLVHGDTLYVEDDRWNRVFVVGEVTNQAALSIPVSGMTLADALNSEQTGGLNLDRVDSAEIYVFRGISKKQLESGDVEATTIKPKVYWLDVESVDALLLADQFRLQPRDIVYASSASLVNYNRGASLVIPTIQTLLQTGILIDRVR